MQYIFSNGNLPQYAIKSSKDDQKLTCAQIYEHPFTSKKVCQKSCRRQPDVETAEQFFRRLHLAQEPPELILPLHNRILKYLKRLICLGCMQ